MRLRNPTLRLLDQVSARLPRRLAQSTVQHTTPIFDIITMCSRSHFAAPPKRPRSIQRVQPRTYTTHQRSVIRKLSLGKVPPTTP